jgi:transposase
MPRPYSTDLRERVLLACEHGRQGRAEIAAQFRIGKTTLYRWRHEARAEHRRQPKPHAGGPAPKLDAAALEALGRFVADADDLTLAEYAERLAARIGVRVSGPTVCRTLRKLGWAGKKDAARGRAGPRRLGRTTGEVASRAGRHRPSAAGLLG